MNLTAENIYYIIDALNDRIQFIKQCGEANSGELESLKVSIQKLETLIKGGIKC